MNARTTFPAPRRRKSDRFLDDRRERRFQRMLALFERDEIEAAVDSLINWLDARDGDIDREELGLEDSFVVHAPTPFGTDGPGCQIADAGGEDEGADGDVAYAEWISLPAARRRAGHVDGIHIGSRAEDAEDDDADTSVEDHPHDPETDCDDVAEISAWPERVIQPGYMLGGLGGDYDEDAEPKFVPASMDRPIAANAS